MPPAPQDVNVRSLAFSYLKSEDNWLTNAQPSLVALTNVRSAHKYALVIFTPFSKGITTSPDHTTELDLQVGDLVQPLQISTSDFGPKGDQIVVKFIDEGATFQQSYSSSLPTLTSSRNP